MELHLRFIVQNGCDAELILLTVRNSANSTECYGFNSLRNSVNVRSGGDTELRLRFTVRNSCGINSINFTEAVRYGSSLANGSEIGQSYGTVVVWNYVV